MVSIASMMTVYYKTQQYKIKGKIMKYLQDYIETEQTRVLNKYDAFFAFSKKQFDEGKKEGIEYTALASGLLVPRKNALELIEELNLIHENGIKQDLKENSKASIIQRELANHEAQITMDINDTMDALDGYNITEEQIRKEYKIFLDVCIENDWF